MADHTYVILAGSNCGDRSRALGLLRRTLRSVGETVESQAVPTPDLTGSGAPYLNMIFVLQTALEPEGLNALFKDLERQAGRTPRSKALHRVELDADLVAADGRILRWCDLESAHFGLCLKTLPPWWQNEIKNYR